MTEKLSDWLLAYAVLFFGMALANFGDAARHRLAFAGGILMGMFAGVCIARILAR